MVYALREGIQAAQEVDTFLMGDSKLARLGGIPVRSWNAPPVTCGSGNCQGGECNGGGDGDEDVKTEVGDDEEKPWTSNGNGEVTVEA